IADPTPPHIEDGDGSCLCRGAHTPSYRALITSNAPSAFPRWCRWVYDEKLTLSLAFGLMRRHTAKQLISRRSIQSKRSGHTSGDDGRLTALCTMCGGALCEPGAPRPCAHRVRGLSHSTCALR